jgi:long-chain acyl-CoA synthetase
MVPVMFSRLLRLPEEVRGRYDTSSLKCIVDAAAPCPVHVKQAMIDWLGPIITEYYGATEANGFTFCDSAQWLAHPGTVGKPILGELLILDEEGNECAPGTDGTIWFRGATAFEYFQDPVETAESRRDDGQTSTVGDVGHVDADGYLYLTDRKMYVIISGGVNIYPQETENILSGHPAVPRRRRHRRAERGPRRGGQGRCPTCRRGGSRPRARSGIDRLLRGPDRALQMSAHHRLCDGAAPISDGQAVQAPAAG